MTDFVRRKLILTIALSVGAALLGPFGTYEDLGLLPRLTYWIIAVAGVGLVMNLAVYLMLTHPDLARYPHSAVTALGVALAAFPGALIVLLLEIFLRGTMPAFSLFVSVWGLVAAIGYAIAFFEYGPKWRRHALGQTAKAQANAPPGDRTNVFLSRLKLEPGQALVSVTVRDHYLEVTTTRGRETLLMRMADAESELADYPGIRIHRSHWVSLDAIESLERDGNRWTVSLGNGAKLPVSRETAPRLKERLGEILPN